MLFFAPHSQCLASGSHRRVLPETLMSPCPGVMLQQGPGGCSAHSSELPLQQKHLLIPPRGRETAPLGKQTCAKHLPSPSLAPEGATSSHLGPSTLPADPSWLHHFGHCTSSSLSLASQCTLPTGGPQPRRNQLIPGPKRKWLHSQESDIWEGLGSYHVGQTYQSSPEWDPLCQL